MTRFRPLLLLLALAACAPSAARQADTAGRNAEAAEAAAVYQQLQLFDVEQQMLDDDKRMTYGFATVNCGLRDTHWLAMLQHVYGRDYQMAVIHHPLTQEQAEEARDFAQAHVSNPSPPPYICGRIAEDRTLADLDYSISQEALVLAARKKPG